MVIFIIMIYMYYGDIYYYDIHVLWWYLLLWYADIMVIFIMIYADIMVIFIMIYADIMVIFIIMVYRYCGDIYYYYEIQILWWYLLLWHAGIMVIFIIMRYRYYGDIIMICRYYGIIYSATQFLQLWSWRCTHGIAYLKQNSEWNGKNGKCLFTICHSPAYLINTVDLNMTLDVHLRFRP